jgi:poly-gamma-glutamate capsule biosynthesis protein CapA/YwtB (metallophosphatase superfamily)
MPRLRSSIALIAVCAVVLATAASADESPRSFTIAAAGDILIHGRVAEYAHGYADGQGYDFSSMFAPIEPWISDADLAICHLESALSSDNTHLSFEPYVYVAPHEIADAIAGAGYDDCSLASNHSTDGGERGVREAIEVFDALDIGHTGTGCTEAERLPEIYEVRDVAVAHISYTYGVSGSSRLGDCVVNVINADAILADARWARQNGAEFVIVSLHWGVENHPPPTSEQQALAETLLSSPDVDLILGHHAHVIQPIDWIDDRLVVYGMGNHLSNQNSVYGPDYYATEDGVLVHITVTEQADGHFATTEVQFTPTWVNWHGYDILPVAFNLEYGPEELRPELEASLQRTVERFTMLTDAETTTAEWPVVMCWGRAATIIGTDGPDLLIGTGGDDVIVGRAGGDTIWGHGGNDYICGRDGNDYIAGGTGDDVISGDDGSDFLHGDTGNDSLWGDDGTNSLEGGAGDDLLNGKAGDLLVGGAGEDTCRDRLQDVPCAF